MNYKGMILGGVIATFICTSLTVGFQLIVWGNNAPDWYAAPVILAGLIAGVVGVKIGATKC